METNSEFLHEGHLRTQRAFNDAKGQAAGKPQGEKKDYWEQWIEELNDVIEILRQDEEQKKENRRRIQQLKEEDQKGGGEDKGKKDYKEREEGTTNRERNATKEEGRGQ